jgi:hypothetical protein
MSNPYRVESPFCISFSGGRTSGFLVAKVLEAHGGRLPAGSHVVFANTGREHERTLEFVRDCANGFGIDIEWVERDFDAEHGVRVVDFATASRNGEPFEQLIGRKQALPNFIRRFCTEELKVRAIARHLKSIGMTEGTMLVGLRADEPRRVARVQGDVREGFDYECPMAKAGHLISDVGAYWFSAAWDLRLPNNDRAFGNCDMCYLKGKRVLERVIREEPERAAWWSRMEHERGRTFVHGRSVDQLLVQVRVQPELFGGTDDGEDNIIPCTCTD